MPIETTVTTEAKPAPEIKPDPALQPEPAKAASAAPAAPSPDLVVSGDTGTFRLEDGRQIVFRKIGPGLRMRLMSIVGAEMSKSEGYMSHATAVYSVVSIDGVQQQIPGKVFTLESQSDTLGDAAILQILVKLKEAFGDEAGEWLERQIALKEEIKNS